MLESRNSFQHKIVLGLFMKNYKPRLIANARNKQLKHFRAFGLLNWGLQSREIICEAEAYLAGLGMQR